jgi:hypothetical protein
MLWRSDDACSGGHLAMGDAICCLEVAGTQELQIDLPLLLAY